MSNTKSSSYSSRGPFTILWILANTIFFFWRSVYGIINHIIYANKQVYVTYSKSE